MAGVRDRLCIIGFGRMGRYFAELFLEGFDIEIITSQQIKPEMEKLGVKKSENEIKTISEVDFILLAVPIEILDKWLEKINKFSKKNCVIMDCCSSRIAAEKKLLKLKRKLFGLHSLYPSSFSITGELNIIISDYLKSKGFNLEFINPEEHDKLNAIIGIAHYIGIVLELNLSKSQRKILKGSKAGLFLLDLIYHLKTNSPSTYKETQILNPYMIEMRDRLISWFKTIHKDLNTNKFDFKAFPREMWRI